MGSARTALVLLDKASNLSEKEALKQIELQAAKENEAIELCRALMKGKGNWKAVAGILKNLKGEPEQTRWAVLGYSKAVLLNSGNYQAYKIITCFENNFYDSKECGLVRASYEAIHGD
jgi:hypothetical protein